MRARETGLGYDVCRLYKRCILHTADCSRIILHTLDEGEREGGSMKMMNSVGL